MSNLDFSNLLQEVLSCAPYSSWTKVGAGPEGLGAWRDAKEDNPSLQLTVLGLYDFKADRQVKNLVDLARELGIVNPGNSRSSGWYRALFQRQVRLLANQVGVDEERTKMLDGVRRRLGVDKEGRQRWRTEQWPIIRKYFAEQRKIPEGVCDERFYFTQLRATVQQFTHPESKEKICEIIIPMFGPEHDGRKLVQIMKIQVNPETGEKIRKGKKLKGSADTDRAIIFGAIEANEVWIFEGIENALSAYVAADPQDRQCRTYIVAGPAAGFAKLGGVTEPYGRKVIICDPDRDQKSLHSSAVLGKSYERISYNFSSSAGSDGGSAARIPDLNQTLSEAGNSREGIAAVRRALREDYKSVPWLEVEALAAVKEEREEDEAEADSYEYHATWNPFSDQGCARFFVSRFGGRVKISEDGRWWVWGGKVWQSTHAESTIRQWIASLLPVYMKMSKDQRRGEGERARAMKFAESLGMANRQSAVMRCLPGHRQLQIRVCDFDNRPDILNVQNGVLELDTGKLLPHHPRHLCSKIAGCEWIEDGGSDAAKSPVFDKFITEIMCADSEPAADLFCYKMRQLGYMISGHVREKAFFFHIGTGDNGKSKESEILQYILGDYARPVSTEIFLENGASGFQNQIMYELAYMPGVRLGIADEPDETKTWSETTIKRFTSGGDKMVARPINKAPFSFVPAFKVMVHGNSKPRIRTGDPALWRRLHLVPYDYRPPVLDTHLPEKLRAEAPGILRRLYQGYREWRSIGLRPPARILESISEYQQEVTANIEDYIEERCEQNPMLESKGSALYYDYVDFCKQKGVRPESQTAFGRKLSMLGFEIRKSDGKKFRQGIALKSFSSGDFGFE